MAQIKIRVENVNIKEWELGNVCVPLSAWVAGMQETSEAVIKTIVHALKGSPASWIILSCGESP